MFEQVRGYEPWQNLRNCNFMVSFPATRWRRMRDSKRMVPTAEDYQRSGE